MNPAIHRALVFPLIELVRAEPIARCLGELNRSQWCSRDELRDLQWRKLRRMLAHCYANVPFYRARFDRLQLHPEEIRSLEDFARLPPLTKDEVRFNQGDIRERGARRRVEQCRSGGTLGIPLTLVRDKLASAYARAAELRGFGWFGIRRGDRQVRIWGVPLDAAAASGVRRKDWLLNRIRISPFEITGPGVRRYYETMRRFGARYIYGYPSAVYAICRVMNEQGLDTRALGIQHTVCSAETVHPHQREYIEAALGCRVVDEYGCCEIGPLALECPAGSLHLTMENVLAEFVETPARFGGSEILLTHLNSYSMPLLRYRIGDTGELQPGDCACGRRLDVMRFGAGRVLSMLVATDGSYVSGTVFCYIAFDIIKKYRGIKDFRAVQKARDRLQITLVKDEASYTSELLARFAERTRERLGQDLQIDFRFVEAIPVEKSGKRLFVYSELAEAGRSAKPAEPPRGGGADPERRG